MNIPRRWIIKNPGNKEIIRSLESQLHIHSTLANLLVQRGITTIEEARNFFRPELYHLHDPYKMLNMNKAVNRFNKAVKNKDKILLYGDYDVDGTSAVAMMYKFLSAKFPQLELDYYIPDRYKEGYGISYQGIEYAVSRGVNLVIALDCGIKDAERVAYAREKNIDFIICDHHLPGDVLPPAEAILNPKQKNCTYPYKELSGCGVGFKFLQAIAHYHRFNFKDLYELLDLVVLSIASDIVPLTGENRVLAYYGLKKINENPSPAIEALLETAGIKRKPETLLKTNYVFTKYINISDLVYYVGPRVNAAGRMHTGRNSVDLLISKNLSEAKNYARVINDFNTERKNIDAQVTSEAIAMIEADESHKYKKSTIVFGENWPKGILGIVASRLIEHFYKPAIVFTRNLEDGTLTGSARSIKGFDLYGALNQFSHLFEHWGGHTYAAGLSIREENFKEFKEAFETFAIENITDEMLVPVIEIDAYLEFNDISKKFFNTLKLFAPFGPENPNPVFMTEEVYDNGYSRLLNNNHIKLMVTQKHYKDFGLPGIAFQLGDYFPYMEKGLPVDIVYTIEENEWNGNVSLQLNVKDMRLSDNDQNYSL